MRKLMVVLALTAALPCLAAVTLTGEKLNVGFEPGEGYALSALLHREHNYNFVDAKAPKALRSPWVLMVRNPQGEVCPLNIENAKSSSHEAGDGKLTVTWRGVTSPACPADLTVTMTLRNDGAKSRWHLKVEGQAPGALWQVDFPRLANLQPLGEDRLLVPQHLGRLTRDPAQRQTRFTYEYPSPLSMQFVATYGTKDPREQELPPTTESGWSVDRSDATGLYVAAEDGQCYYKRFGYDTRETKGQMGLWVENVPELAKWPVVAGQVSYSLPYEVAVAAFTGESPAATDLYREFAVKQAWCSRGTADKWPAEAPAPGTKELAQWTPTWFRESGFWAKFYQDPGKVVPEWAAYEKWLQVPIASHYYRGTIAVFDDNYPEMLPTDPYYISGVRDAKDMNVRPLPYTNGVIWDTDTQSYLNANGQAGAIKDEAGKVPLWDLRGEMHAYMCPGAKQWRDKVAETAYKQVAEHGLSGVYLDCLTATSSLPCYDPNHGHPLRGGSYYAQGQRQMMLDTRAKTRAVDPGAGFFPEECGEWVIDVMDGFLTLDISRAGRPPREQVFPLFAQVYHDYTINFGCDAALDQEPDRFAWEMGSMLAWGGVPLNSPSVAPDPKPGDANSEMLRDVVQGYYVAGLPFLQGGQALPMVTRPQGSSAPKRAGVDLAAKPYEFRFENKQGKERAWSGPAVMGSAWRRGGDVGIVLVNLTAQDQPVELRVAPAVLGLAKDAKLLRTWPLEPQEVGAAATTSKLTVPAQRMMMLVVTSNVAQASQGRKLLETPWELLRAEEGEFGPLQGPAGTLWACADGPVANALTAQATAATPKSLDQAGQLTPRRGFHPKLPEGAAFPRKYDEKPFLLLRRLPVQVTGTGAVTVLAGDETYLSAVADGGVTLAFPGPGLLIVSEAATGKVVTPMGVAQKAELPAGQQYVVGYVDARAFMRSASDVGRLLQSADADSRAKLDKLLGLAEKLADASAALADLEQSLSELPGALTPGTPLERLHQQTQALVTAQVGGKLWLTVPHDWLAPGLPTPVMVRQFPALKAEAPAQVAAIGGWQQPAQVSPLQGGQAMVTVTDPTYVERMVPVLALAQVTQGNETFVLSSLLQMDANRPLELQVPEAAATAVAGRESRIQIGLRNWSPLDLQLNLAAQAPDGWDVKLPKNLDVAALTDGKATMRLTPPAGAPQGTVALRVTATYAPGGPTLVGVAAVAVQPQVGLLEDGGDWPRPKAEELATLRGSGRLVLYAAAGEPLNLAINNVRVTQYVDSVAYQLLDPDLKVAAAGRIAVDKSHPLQYTATQAGAHFLELVPMSGSAVVSADVRGAAEVATAISPLRVYCSRLTRYFYVPTGAKCFRLGAQDGGPDEGAKIVLTAPGGRVALQREGGFSGAEAAVEVQSDEAGKVWALRVEPLQDLALWLAGDVCPYLSTAPERVLIDRR